jgi:hypothetical protein
MGRRFNATEPGGFDAHCYSQESLAALRLGLDAQGFQSYEIDGSRVEDKPSLFQEIEAHVPVVLHTPRRVNYSWDALMDDLWDGLRDKRKAAILWLHADRLLSGNLQLLLDALSCLEELQRSFPLFEDGHRTILRVILLGNGPNFPPFPPPDEEPSAPEVPLAASQARQIQRAIQHRDEPSGEGRPALSTSQRQLVLEVLERLGRKYPAMRFGQLTAFAAFLVRGPSASAVWDVEDEELLRAVEEHLSRHPDT